MEKHQAKALQYIAMWTLLQYILYAFIGWNIDPQYWSYLRSVDNRIGLGLCNVFLWGFCYWMSWGFHKAGWSWDSL